MIERIEPRVPWRIENLAVLVLTALLVGACGGGGAATQAAQGSAGASDPAPVTGIATPGRIAVVTATNAH